MKKELLKGLTDEQIAKVKACKNQEELLELAKEENIDLTDEQLEAVSGGGCGKDRKDDEQKDANDDENNNNNNTGHPITNPFQSLSQQIKFNNPRF